MEVDRAFIFNQCFLVENGSLGELGLASQAGEVGLTECYVVFLSVYGVLLHQFPDLTIQLSLSLAL